MLWGGKQLAMLKIVIIGAGLMGRHHARIARRLGATVTGVVDSDHDAALRLCRTIPQARSATSLSALLSAGRVDAAHLCTPAGSHMPIALELAEAGVHALIEKPVTETVEEARILTEAFGRTDALVCPVHQYAFQRGMGDALNSLERLGQLKHIAFDIVSAGGGSDPAEFDRIAGEILPHPLSMLQRLYPEIGLGALRWRMTQAQAGEWLIGTVHDGALISISISLGGRPTAFSTRLSGTEGTIELNNFHDYSVFMPGAVSRSVKIAQPFQLAAKHLAGASLNLSRRAWHRETAYPGLMELTRLFYSAVEDRKAFSVPVSTTQVIDLAKARDTILAQLAGHDG